MRIVRLCYKAHALLPLSYSSLDRQTDTHASSFSVRVFHMLHLKTTASLRLASPIPSIFTPRAQFIITKVSPLDLLTPSTARSFVQQKKTIFSFFFFLLSSVSRIPMANTSVPPPNSWAIPTVITEAVFPTQHAAALALEELCFKHDYGISKGVPCVPRRIMTTILQARNAGSDTTVHLEALIRKLPMASNRLRSGLATPRRPVVAFRR